MHRPDPMNRARFDALVAKTDGSDVKKISLVMEVLHEGDADRLGRYAGEELRKQLPSDFLQADK